MQKQSFLFSLDTTRPPSDKGPHVLACIWQALSAGILFCIAYMNPNSKVRSTFNPYPCLVNKWQRTPNQNADAVGIRRICERSNQPEINKQVK